MSTVIATQWLEASADSANNKEHERHMALISSKIRLTGVPGYDSIGYDDWARQTKHEFENNILKRVSYRGLKMIAETATHIMFKTHETVEATDGTVNAQGVEMVLEQEADGVWRLIQERVLSAEEATHDGLIEKHC